MRANTWKKLAGDFTIRRLTIVLGIVRKEILCVKKKREGRKERAGETEREKSRDRPKERRGKRDGEKAVGKLSVCHCRGNYLHSIET